jgi:hypothetical protein
MKNIGIAIAAVVVILIVAIGGVFVLKSSKTPAKTQTQSVNTQAAKPQTTNSLKGTIIGLVSGGKTVNCQVTYPDNKGTGSIFVADKKFAGDFDMKGADGKETSAHVISDGVDMYVWSSGLPMGIKMSLAAAKNAAQNPQANQSFNVNQEVNFNCNSWTPDTSKFTVPTNIQFRDMSGLLQGAQPQVTTAPTAGAQTGTSPCDQVPAGPARTACQNAMQSSGK